MTTKGVCVFECIVVERENDIIKCESFPLDGDVREFWEIEIPGVQWDEGQAFYMCIPKASLEKNVQRIEEKHDFKRMHPNPPTSKFSAEYWRYRYQKLRAALEAEKRDLLP